MKDEALYMYLPGELRHIAEVTGMDAAVRLGLVFGGSMLYVPMVEDLQRMVRNERIQRDYHRGVTARMLARRHGLTERSIWRVLNQPGPSIVRPEIARLIDAGLEENVG